MGVGVEIPDGKAVDAPIEVGAEPADDALAEDGPQPPLIKGHEGEEEVEGHHEGEEPGQRPVVPSGDEIDGAAEEHRGGGAGDNADGDDGQQGEEPAPLPIEIGAEGLQGLCAVRGPLLC